MRTVKRLRLAPRDASHRGTWRDVGRAAALTLAASVALAACQKRPPPPQESWAIVTAESAPLLRTRSPTNDVQDIARAGELVKVIREIEPMHWHAKIDGVPAERDGMALEVKYVNAGNVRYAFQPDLGPPVSVPTASWLCEQLAGNGPFDLSRCPDELRRAKTADGALLLFVPCATGPCPVAVWRDDKLTAIAVDDINAVYFFVGKKRSLLVASTRWSKDAGKQSGGAFVPIVIENGAPVAKAAIDADRVDARDADKVVAHLAEPRVTATEIVFKGTETTRAADGSVLSTKPIDEKYALPALD